MNIVNQINEIVANDPSYRYTGIAAINFYNQLTPAQQHGFKASVDVTSQLLLSTGNSFDIHFTKTNEFGPWSSVLDTNGDGLTNVVVGYYKQNTPISQQMLDCLDKVQEMAQNNRS